MNRLLSNFFICCLVFTSFDVVGQCSISAPASPQAFGTNTSSGVVGWSNLSGTDVSDNSYAQVSALVLGDDSYWLLATDFNFGLPATTAICGVEVSMEKRASGILQNVQDVGVQLIVGGSLVGENKAIAATWPTTDTYFTHGGAADLWGEALTVTDVNAANFGVGIKVDLSGISALPTAFIDHIQITIHYSSTLPIELGEFTASNSEPSNTLIEWTTKSELNNDYFILEHSEDGSNWDFVADIKAVGNSSIDQYYEYEDLRRSGANYYRLSQVDYDGTLTVLEETKVILDSAEETRVFPNPVKNQCLLQASEDINLIEVYNSDGSLIDQIIPKSNSTAIDVNRYKAGVYFLRIQQLNGMNETVKFVKID